MDNHIDINYDVDKVIELNFFFVDLALLVDNQKL